MSFKRARVVQDCVTSSTRLPGPVALPVSVIEDRRRLTCRLMEARLNPGVEDGRSATHPVSFSDATVVVRLRLAKSLREALKRSRRCRCRFSGKGNAISGGTASTGSIVSEAVPVGRKISFSSRDVARSVEPLERNVFLVQFLRKDGEAGMEGLAALPLSGASYGAPMAGRRSGVLLLGAADLTTGGRVNFLLGEAPLIGILLGVDVAIKFDTGGLAWLLSCFVGKSVLLK